MDPETCDKRVSAIDGGNFVSRGSWNITSQKLYLTTAVQIYRKTYVKLTIPDSFGLRLPLNGLESDHPTLEIGGSFQSGDVLMTRIERSDRVAVLENFAFKMVPAMVEEHVYLCFTFNHTASLRNLTTSETIDIRLPGFQSQWSNATDVYSSLSEDGSQDATRQQIDCSQMCVFLVAWWDSGLRTT